MKALFLFLLAYCLVIMLTPFVFIFNIIRLYLVGVNIISYIDISAIGFDQAGGAVLYGKENYTISSYTHYLCEYKGSKCLFERFINFFFGQDHCKKSFEWECVKDKKDLQEFYGVYSGKITK